MAYIDTDSSGRVGFAGSYVEADTTRSGVWISDGTGQSTLLARDSDPVIGVSGSTLFDGARSLSVGSDGSLMAFARYRGAEAGSALVEIDADGVRHVLRGGDPAPGLESAEEVFGEGRTIRSIVRYSNASGGSVIVAIFSSSSVFLGSARGLWYRDQERFEPILVQPGYAGFDYPSTGDGCRVALAASESRRVYSYGDDAFVFAGDVIGVDTAREDASCSGRAIVSVADGAVEIVARSGQPVPGTMGTVYASFQLQPATTRGAIVARVTTRQADGSTGPSSRPVAQMLFEPRAERGFDVRLIVLDGETLPPDYTQTYVAGTLTGINNSTRLRVAAGPHAALSYGNVNDPTLYTGAPHAGQPYSSFLNPGASTFELVASRSSPPPAGYPETAFFSRRGPIEADVDGGVHFAGRLSDAAVTGPGSDVAQGLWRADANGTVTPRILAGEEIIVDGLKLRVRSIPTSIEGLSNGLDVNDDGSLLVSTDVQRVSDDGSLGRLQSVVLRLPAVD